jgi:SAM-dependent methyltransferase
VRWIREYWDAAADDFDREPDHGLGRPEVRAAWAGRLAAWVPRAGLDALDVGCGTGSLSVLLAQRGHRVTGLDLSTRMAGYARAKLAAAGRPGLILVADAADPPVRPASFDVVLARHLLWTLPDPPAVLRRWIALLRPGGRLVLVEGRWGSARDAADGAGAAAQAGATDQAETGGRAGLPWFGGVGAGVLGEVLAPRVARLDIEPLTDPRLWGRDVDDERYAALAVVAGHGAVNR